ncbi:putative hydrolase [Gordonia effusa NBRC 100432]|uniref:Putative hydrolase n=1 Tax=Gordonia effusa NBRC 100432 TaxID=1077974 RepID=H0R153_9ACTN|nr:alpha/beta fold hydrolase [Gordonia effusa]GAB18804.1 putative hydrolase [Gordonia effusa NBRC 100432]
MTTPDLFRRAYDDMLSRWPVPVESVCAPVGRVRVHMNVCGPVDAPPVALFAGAGATSTVWFANAARLAQSNRVIAVDIPGDAGLSTVDGKRLSPDELVDACDQAIRQVSAGRAVRIVGHSYGAQCALTYALRHSDRIASLVLLDPNGCFTGINPRYLLRAMPGLIAPSARRTARLINWETARGQSPDVNWVRLSQLAAPLFPVRALTIPRRPKAASIDELPMPISVILAAESRVHNPRRVATLIKRRFSDIDVASIAVASHHSVPTSPAAPVTDAIVDALLRQ